MDTDLKKAFLLIQARNKVLSQTESKVPPPEQKEKKNKLKKFLTKEETSKGKEKTPSSNRGISLDRNESERSQGETPTTIFTEGTTTEQNYAERNKNNPHYYVSEEQFNTDIKNIKEFLDELNIGLNSEFIITGIMSSTYYIERGVYKFVDFAKIMIDLLGDKIRPHLILFYNICRELSISENRGFDKYMTPAEELKNIDIYNFDKF